MTPEGVWHSHGAVDGFHAVPATVSKTCLVRFDNNKYSVAASAVGSLVEIRAYADPVELRQDGRVVGEHRLLQTVSLLGVSLPPFLLGILLILVFAVMLHWLPSFGRGQTVYDPWHYVPGLARKPGALRNGAPVQGVAAAGSARADAPQARQGARR